MKALNVLILITLLAPVSVSALEESGSGVKAPQTMEEARDFSWKIAEKIPGTIKKIWQGEVWPLWKRIYGRIWYDWTKPFLEKWWHQLLDLLNREVEKKKPELEEEFRAEKEEIKKDIWERFKELLD